MSDDVPDTRLRGLAGWLPADYRANDPAICFGATSEPIPEGAILDGAVAEADARLRAALSEQFFGVDRSAPASRLDQSCPLPWWRRPIYWRDWLGGALRSLATRIDGLGPYGGDGWDD